LTLGPVNLAAETGFWLITWQNMGAAPKVPSLAPERAETEPRIEVWRALLRPSSTSKAGAVKAASKSGAGMSLRHAEEVPAMKNVLVLVRHGESEWNRLNMFTGWQDVDLTEEGVAEAHRAGAMLKAEGAHIDVACTSLLKRAQNTLKIILSELDQDKLPIVYDAALNERHYGDLVGLNKDEARQRWGEEQVHLWQRSYDIAPPGGESLKDTAARVLPFYAKRIAPELQAGKSVILVGHGNSLRALVMQLDRLSPEQVKELIIGTGMPLIYRLRPDGTVAEKRDLAA
jgi:2,3-bisphosphoglycerate-dependent phosphoglycerate mutase